MTDYSNTIADLTQQQLAACSDGDLYPRDAARLEIGVSGDVRVRINTYVTNSDPWPMRLWHRMTLALDINANAQIDDLRETLADGGEASALIDRVIAGHGSRWDGRNFVGTLTDDADQACIDLGALLANFPTSNWAAMDVIDYLYPLGSGRAQLDSLGLTDQSGPDAIAAAAVQLVEDAARDRVVLTGDVVRYLTWLVNRTVTGTDAE